MYLIVWLTDTDEAKTLLDIPLIINCVIIDQLAMNLVDICLDNMLKLLLRRSLDLCQRLEFRYFLHPHINHFSLHAGN